MTEHESKSRNQWWRWPAVPVAAVFGATVLSLTVGLAQRLGAKWGGGSENGLMLHYVIPFGTAALFGWLFVWIACAVAPSNKVIAGAVMTTILFFGLLAMLSMHWLLLPVSPAEDIARDTFGSIAALVAGILATIEVHRDELRGQSVTRI